MSIHVWLAFVAASAVLLIIPGPTVLTVVSYSIAQGRRASLPVVAGVTLGDSTAVAISILGLGALLATSAFVFTVIKLAGGLYLLYLGIRLLRAGASLAELATRVAPDSRRSLFLNTYLVTALNPKSIVFFVAFLPQFVNPAAAIAQQLWILALTFVFMATVNAGMYSTFAASANQVLTSPRAQRRFNLAGGSLLSAAGVWVLLARHSS
jgi:threonine/homoserine/homoserine lactone efflux protein